MPPTHATCRLQQLKQKADAAASAMLASARGGFRHASADDPVAEDGLEEQGVDGRAAQQAAAAEAAAGMDDGEGQKRVGRRQERLIKLAQVLLAARKVRVLPARGACCWADICVVCEVGAMLVMLGGCVCCLQSEGDCLKDCDLQDAQRFSKQSEPII